MFRTCLPIRRKENLGQKERKRRFEGKKEKEFKVNEEDFKVRVSHKAGVMSSKIVQRFESEFFRVVHFFNMFIAT